MPSSVKRWARPTVRLPLTSEPSTATPTTEPSSRLVVVADAAIPECAGGITARATDVIGTTAMPNPKPARVSATASETKWIWPCRARSANSTPAPAARQPTAMGTRGPALPTHLPASTEDRIIATAIGTKSSAMRYAE